MQESEITADLSKESFDRYIQKFTQELGVPQLRKRISFMVLKRGQALDNRIKITNGKARIVQKIKRKTEVEGERVNEEVEIDIPDTLEDVKLSIKLFENFYDVFEEDPLKLVVQHENYIWETKEFELKIARQFGKADLFLYEIESFGEKRPQQLQNELGLKGDYDSFAPDRQLLRREGIDTPFSDLSKEEFDQLIIKYLNYKS